MADPQFARKRNENLQSTSAIGLPALTLGEDPCFLRAVGRSLRAGQPPSENAGHSEEPTASAFDPKLQPLSPRKDHDD